MKLSFLNLQKSPSFQKLHLANAAFIQNDVQVPCAIYKLERNKDAEYFQNIPPTPWINHGYFENIKDEWEHTEFEDEDFFTLENMKGQCLALCTTDTYYADRNELVYLQVKPTLCSRNPKRKVKYLGETLMAFLAGFAKKQGKKMLAVPIADTSAVKFYTDNCKMEQSAKRGIILKDFEFDNLLQQNEAHTKTRMEFLG